MASLFCFMISLATVGVLGMPSATCSDASESCFHRSVASAPEVGGTFVQTRFQSKGSPPGDAIPITPKMTMTAEIETEGKQITSTSAKSTTTMVTTTSTSTSLVTWTLTEGPCTVTDEGCIQSGNYPLNYNNSLRCLFDWNVDAEMYMDVKEFNTERGYDTLYVGAGLSSRFTGQGIDFSPHGDRAASIRWEPDDYSSRTGWKICPVAKVRQDTWTLKSGDCTVTRSGCIQSPNHPMAYGFAQECSFDWNVSTELYMDVETFNTESGWDVLRVGTSNFSGSDKENSPHGEPAGPISWSSGWDIQKSGWKICLSAKKLEKPPNTTVATYASSSNGCASCSNCCGEKGSCVQCKEYRNFMNKSFKWPDQGYETYNHIQKLKAECEAEGEAKQQGWSSECDDEVDAWKSEGADYRTLFLVKTDCWRRKANATDEYSLCR